MPGLLDPASVGGAATGGLLDAFMPHALTQLQQQQQQQQTAAAPGGAPAPAAARPGALELVNTAADLANQSAYGTSDPQKLGALASAGFPLFNDPRLIQDQLANMAQAGDKDAADEFQKMIGGGGGFSFAGYGGGGNAGPGGGGPAGSDVSSGPGSW